MRATFLRLALPALAAALAAACGDSPSASPAASAAAEAVVLDRAAVTLLRPGDTARVTARVGSQGTTAPSLSVVAEARWLHDAPVLDAAALAAGQIRAAAPGTATLEVRAFGGAPARLEVRFLPGAPLVLSAAADADGGADAFRLRGYRLERVAAGAVTVGGAAARLAGQDSATLRVVAPRAAGADACAGEVVRVSGAEVAPGVVVRRDAGERLRLTVGQQARLQAGAAGCLRLDAVPGARYALAFLDARWVRAAQGGFEGRAPASPFYSVSVAEAGREGAAPAASAAPRLLAAPDAMRRSAAAGAEEGSPFARTTAWREGERIELRGSAVSSPVAARVVRVYGGHLVFALAEGEEPVGGVAGWTARADSAFALMVSRGYPVLRGALTPTLPATSAASGQLLVVARREGGAALGSAVSATVGGRELSVAFLNTAHGASASGILRTLAHEVAHAWQQQYAWETRPAGSSVPAGTTPWAAEGGAELLAWMVLRDVRGMALEGNWDWAAGMDAPGQAAVALLPAGSRGDFTAGYASAASFQLDLVTRLVRRGVAEAEAVALVSRGALEGWHGFDPAGARRAGLAGRVRPHLGGAWDPAGALLTWTLAQALDDRTGDPELQNPTFRAVSTAGEASARGWLPQAVLKSGGAARPGHDASRALVVGNAASLQWNYGSPNYFLIEDDGVGAAYRLRADWNGAPLEETEWMVVRYQ